MLIAGVNLYALALVLELLLGWPIIVGIVVAAVIVLAYITLGGLSSAIYNEVLQFFVIIAALMPLTIVGLLDVGGWDGLKDKIRDSELGEAGLHALRGHGAGQRDQPDRRDLDRRSSSASASCSPSATGRRTSPRSSARCRPRTSRRPSARR